MRQCLVFLCLLAGIILKITVLVIFPLYRCDLKKRKKRELIYMDGGLNLLIPVLSTSSPHSYNNG